MAYEYSKAKKVFSGFRGYDRWMKTVININQFDCSEIAKYRLKVISHYQQFGLESTLSAYPVKRSTLYLWLSKLKKHGGKITSLVPQSTRPKMVRVMQTNPKILLEIKRLRKRHYRLGKNKLKPLIDDFCQKEGTSKISASLIGKIIKRNNLYYQRSLSCHDPDRKKPERKAKLRVKRAPKPESGGYIQADTVEKRVGDLKRYTISFIDVKLKIAYSKTFSGKLSKYTLETFHEFASLLPIEVKTVQTDNGSEFAGEFQKYLKRSKIKQVFIYPNCPKINGVIERYNRSVQEEWIDTYLDEMIDPKRFNQILNEYLYFYNNKRVHESLNLKTPASTVGIELISPTSPICM